MESFLLFIRDDGREDVVALYPDEASARTALMAYVRDSTTKAGRLPPTSDDDAIATYFRDRAALYAIARVAPTAR